MDNIFRVYFLLRQDTTCAGEGFIDLVIQFLAIGYNHECPVSGECSENLLRKEQH